MSQVTLAQLRAQLRASEYENDDLLQECLDSAETVVIRGTNRTETELIELGGGTFPADLRHAILLVASEYYSVAEEGTPLKLERIPDSARSIVKSYKRLVPDGIVQPYFITAQNHSDEEEIAP